MTEPIDLDEWIGQATELLQGRSAGQAMCTFTKAGISVPGMKYAEGRWAALREVQRAVHSGTELTEAAPAAEQSWTEQLEALQQRSAGKDWIAYRSGGIDVLAELIAQLGIEGRSRAVQP
ncbi:MAG TPA: hypothetical protein DCM67_03190 [Propionibacteriaceae bacterium]|nr:hypothetical protein [Propionibacteriaceae bacterium]